MKWRNYFIISIEIIDLISETDYEIFDLESIILTNTDKIKFLELSPSNSRGKKGLLSCMVFYTSKTLNFEQLDLLNKVQRSLESFSA